VAIALELLVHNEVVGMLFSVLAVCIAAGAFFGRYHYAIDVIIGAILAVISFALFGHLRL
jgi:uncharacterized membrane protein YccC